MDKYLVIILAFWLINQFVWRLETWRPRAHMRRRPDWIEQCITSPPTQYRPIGYMGDGFYRSKDPTNSIKVLKERDGDQNIARPRPRPKSGLSRDHCSMQITQTACVEHQVGYTRKTLLQISITGLAD